MDTGTCICFKVSPGDLDPIKATWSPLGNKSDIETYLEWPVTCMKCNAVWVML